jgi:hypothetical protein
VIFCEDFCALIFGGFLGVVFCEDFCVVFFLLPDHFVQHAFAQTTFPDFALNFFAPQCLHFGAEEARDSTAVIRPERFVPL